MLGYIDENNWIDLSNLPRIHGKAIYWAKSVGAVVKFKYHGIEMELIILEHRPRQHGVRIFVKDYTNENGYTLETFALTHCQFGGLLKKNILLYSPDSIQYLVNDDDKFLPCCSQKTIEAQCPICGLKKQTRVTELTHYGLCCNRCSDGVSYPNKFMLNLLDQINIPYDFEVSKLKCGYQWLENYRYDFLISLDNKNYFIEMDGFFHFNNKIAPDVAYKQQAVDTYKDDLAQQHNFEIIRINCNYSQISDRYNFIKNSILKSDLCPLLKLTDINIDWDECNMAGCANLYKQACDYWNSGIRHVKSIANIMKLNVETVRRYLKGGAEFGLCDYDPSQAILEYAANRARPIAIFDDSGNLLHMFRSCADTVEQSMLIFGKQFTKSTVFACCSNRTKRAYGYFMRYITLDEYNKGILNYENTTIQN